MLRSFRGLSPPRTTGSILKKGLGFILWGGMFILWGGMFAFMPWNKKVFLIFPTLISTTNFVFCALYSWTLRKLEDDVYRVKLAVRSLVCFYFASGLLMLASSILMGVQKYNLGKTLVYVSQCSKELNAFD